jgi:hypothetical protein
MSMRAWGVRAVATLLVLAGCSSSGHAPAASPATPAPAASTAPKPVDPLLLVGSWNVLTPAGRPMSTLLRIGDDLELFPRCGDWIGTWSANASGMFLAETDGGSGSCFTNGRGPAPSWLTSATRFTVDGRARSLLNAAGDVLVRLVPGRAVVRSPNLAELRTRLATAPALPKGLVTATTKALTGRWLPAPVRRYPAGTPAVTFAADGSWSGSDGCNGQGGRWLIGTDGAVVSTAGPSTLIGCAGVPVGSWVSRARRAAFDGATLVLEDAFGHEIGRLLR